MAGAKAVNRTTCTLGPYSVYTSCIDDACVFVLYSKLLLLTTEVFGTVEMF